MDVLSLCHYGFGVAV